MRTATLLCAALLSLCLLGCKKGMSEEEYAKAFASICQDYGAYATNLEKDLSPVKPGMNEQQIMAAFAKSVNTGGDKCAEFQKKEEALQPPEKFVGLHQQAIQFYKVQADGIHAWGDALAKGDRANAEKLSEKMVNSMMAEAKGLVAELQKLAAGDPELEKALRDMQQSAVSP